MRPVLASLLVSIVLGSAGLVSAAQAGLVPAHGAPSARDGAGPVPQAPNAWLVAAALTAPGTLVRADGAVRVVRIAPRSPTQGDGALSPVFRVRIEGWFPPRALRYVVVAAGRPVAFGVPSARLDSLVSITTDPAVLTDRIGVRYGGRAVKVGGVPVANDGGDIADHDRGSIHVAFGPLEVTKRAYDLGDEVFQPSELTGKVELAADVHYPRGLPGGPYPLVLFLHGNHSTCYRHLRARYSWPCPDGWKPLPNHEGYDYIAGRLASYGFVVVSVSANGVNVLGNQVADTGMRQRGEVLERHLGLWRRWSTTGGGPFGSRFVDHVDLTKIGTMGHSRGGEGAVWQVIVDRERADPFGIDAVLPLAPVDFTRETVNGVPMAIMLPYCDGDVSDLQGVHFFDDARYRSPGDRTPKQTVTVFGANHNFFNTVWSPSSGFPGSFDDGTRHCQGRLRAIEQRRVGAATIVSFFRRYVAGDGSQDAIWTGERPIPGIAPAKALLSYLAPDTWRRRLDLDRFTDAGSLSVNELGGAVVDAAMSTFDWCADTQASQCIAGRFGYSDIHLPGLARGIFGWSGPGASVRFRLPAGTGDVRRFDALQLRTALDPGSSLNRVDVQDLVVTLIDGDGDRDSVSASSVGNDALVFPSRVRRFEGHTILQQLRFPMTAFAGVDRSDLRVVQIRFSRTDAGEIHVADLAFAS